MQGKDQVEEIKRKIDIIALVQEHVPSLKKSGRNHFGLCPFHQEKSPSFSVNADEGYFKCFGCGEGGDVITFIQKIEGIDFPRALEIAAEKAGIKLEKNISPAAKRRYQQKKKLLQANKLTADYYQYVLFKHPMGENCRKYLKQRKIRKEEAEKFNLGFAPGGYENLKKFLLKKDFKEKELVEWGLLVSKNNKIYDKFRDRLMFPIQNHFGEIVGFSGRLIDKDAFGPKYLNSPETVVYKKSEILYGLSVAKKSLRTEDFAVIVEGNIDILASHKEGVENIIAPLGTAITEEQMKLLHRYCGKVYFALDTDEAGEKALLKGVEIAQQVGLETRAIDIKDYQDVDEFISAGEDWKKAVKKAMPIIEYLMQRYAKKFDLTKVQGQVGYVKSVFAFLVKLTDKIEQTKYLEVLAERSGVDQELLMAELDNINVNPNNEGIKSTKLEQKILQKTSLSKREIYFLAFLYNHLQWLKEIKLQQFLEICHKSKIKEIIEYLEKDKGSAKAKKSKDDDYREVILTKVDIYEKKADFVAESNKLLKKIVEEHLRYLIREESSLEKVQQYTKLLKQYQ
jgi:DNA primase